MLNLYSALFTREDSNHFCENLGAKMPPVSNNDIDDTNEESVWHDTFTGKPLTYTPPPWMGTGQGA